MCVYVYINKIKVLCINRINPKKIYKEEIKIKAEIKEIEIKIAVERITKGKTDFFLRKTNKIDKTHAKLVKKEEKSMLQVHNTRNKKKSDITTDARGVYYTTICRDCDHS